MSDELNNVAENVEAAAPAVEAEPIPSMDEFKDEIAHSFRKIKAGDIVNGTVIGVSIVNIMTSYIGKISINMPAVIVMDIVFLIFCFGCAYFGARKIKKISVYELMTE